MNQRFLKLHRNNCAHRLVSFLLALSGILTHGCSSHYAAPVEDVTDYPTASAMPAEPPPVRAAAPRDEYRIVAGDTLFSIAWRFGLDYRLLAHWNNIGPPYTIHPGQRLHLKPPATLPSSAPLASNRASTPPPPAPAIAARREMDSIPATRPAPQVSTPPPRQLPAASSKILWQWPARGKIVSASSVLGQRGINILGARGQPIMAAAPGEVVYSGSGLVGYGKLIIIKHNETFLSAYAHNDRLLVGEGARVIGGQQIAEMGSTGTRQVMLHFEIRRDGKPVPPIQYLP
ncbi:MAG: peptidoglycan DD-metalloendopeptidase family protein [Chromatiales bacterium]